MLLPYLDKIRQNYKIILGSASENRQKILCLSGLNVNDFEVMKSTFKEDLPKTNFKNTIEYVQETSYQKLLDLTNRIQNEKCQFQNDQKSIIVICCDTIISIDDQQVLEKPDNEEHAFVMLKKLSQIGKHQVYSSVWINIIQNNNQKYKQNFTKKTDVYFKKNITDIQIRQYIDSKEPFGKAGAYGIQGLGATFIDKIDGDFYSVWGFPLSDFCENFIDMLDKDN